MVKDSRGKNIMTDRQLLLHNLRIAGYENDNAAWFKAYIDGAGKVSRKAADNAWELGAAQRVAGLYQPA